MPREDRPEDDPLLDVRVTLFVERESQKAIVIGKGGSRLREVGTNARREIQALLGRRVHLDLRVKVAKDWQRDPKQLQRLGFCSRLGFSTARTRRTDGHDVAQPADPRPRPALPVRRSPRSPGPCRRPVPAGGG